MVETLIHYAPLVLSVVGIGLYALPKLQAQAAAVPDSLAARILADLPSLKAAEANMQALGRDAAEIVALFESQLAKRIAEAKAVPK